MHDAPRRLKSPVAPLMTQIHPTAVVDPAARLHESVVVGPYTIVGPHVEIGAGSSVWYNCVLRADVFTIRIGERTNIQDGTIIVDGVFDRYTLVLGVGGSQEKVEIIRQGVK